MNCSAPIPSGHPAPCRHCGEVHPDDLDCVVAVDQGPMVLVVITVFGVAIAVGIVALIWLVAWAVHRG